MNVDRSVRLRIRVELRLEEFEGFSSKHRLGDSLRLDLISSCILVGLNFLLFFDVSYSLIFQVLQLSNYFVLNVMFALVITLF